MKESVIARLREDYIQDVLMQACPLWSRVYRSLFSGQDHVHTEKFDREMWAMYMSQSISHAEYRVHCNLEWPFLSEPLREEVLCALQSTLFRGIKLKFSLKGQTSANNHFPSSCIHLETSNDHKISVSSQLSENDSFSFIIIDNDLIFEPPTKPYHQFRTIFKITSVNEGVLKNLFFESV